MSLMDLYFNGGGSVRRDRPLPNTPPPGSRMGPPSNIGFNRMGASSGPSYGGGFPPNTMGLMQGDIRDTHHYPEGPLGVDLNSNYNDSFNRPGTGQIINRGNTGEIGGESYWNAALQGGMNRRNDNTGIMSKMAYTPGSYWPNPMYDIEDDDFTPSYIPDSVIEMDMMPGLGTTDWEGKWESTADPYDWSSLGMGGQDGNQVAELGLPQPLDYQNERLSLDQLIELGASQDQIAQYLDVA